MKKETATFIEMPQGEYEKFIRQNTTVVRHEFAELHRSYENGIEVSAEEYTYIDMRKKAAEGPSALYIYSQSTLRLWCVYSHKKAKEIFAKELDIANNYEKRNNEFRRRKSITTAQETFDSDTRWLTIPIVSKYSFSELFELAFASDTPNDQAANYQKAIRAAIKKFGENTDVIFSVPFFPGRGKIRFELKNG